MALISETSYPAITKACFIYPVQQNTSGTSRFVNTIVLFLDKWRVTSTHVFRGQRRKAQSMKLPPILKAALQLTFVFAQQSKNVKRYRNKPALFNAKLKGGMARTQSTKSAGHKQTIVHEIGHADKHRPCNSERKKKIKS